MHGSAERHGRSSRSADSCHGWREL
jgi:hypothetical protein